MLSDVTAGPLVVPDEGPRPRRDEQRHLVSPRRHQARPRRRALRRRLLRSEHRPPAATTKASSTATRAASIASPPRTRSFASRSTSAKRRRPSWSNCSRTTIAGCGRRPCGCSAIARTSPSCRWLTKWLFETNGPARARSAVGAEPHRAASTRRSLTKRWLMPSRWCGHGPCGCLRDDKQLGDKLARERRPSWRARNRASTSAASLPPARTAAGGRRACRSSQACCMHDEDAGDIHVPLLALVGDRGELRQGSRRGARPVPRFVLCGVPGSSRTRSCRG